MQLPDYYRIHLRMNDPNVIIGMRMNELPNEGRGGNKTLLDNTQNTIFFFTFSFLLILLFYVKMKFIKTQKLRRAAVFSLVKILGKFLGNLRFSTGSRKKNYFSTKRGGVRGGPIRRKKYFLEKKLSKSASGYLKTKTKQKSSYEH